MTWEEACRILGVESSASEQEIREQYRYKVQLLHPDWNLSKPTGVRARAEDELKQVTAAYNVLKESTNNPFINSPKLDITLTKIRFKDVGIGQKKSMLFEVKNIGGAYSKIWIDDSPAPWLRVTDIKSLTNEMLPLEVTIEVTGTGEPDKHYACSLGVRLENEQTKAKDESIVRVELWTKPEPGNLKVKVKKEIKFKSVEPGKLIIKSFELSNIGRGTLQGHLFTTRPWLAVSPDSVSIPPSINSTYIVTLASKNLRRGFSDRALINIITNGGNARIPVRLSVARFSLKQLYKALHYFVLCCLLAFVPVSIIKFDLPQKYWQTSLFWVAVTVYLVIIIGTVHRLRFWNKKQKPKTYNLNRK